MKYQKKFKIRDNPNKIYLRMNIIKDYLDHLSLTEISKKEKCTIKTVRKWVNRYKVHDLYEKDEIFDFTSKERKRKISIPYNIQKYIAKKASNKSIGGKDVISLNYLVSKINYSKKIRKKLKFHGSITKSSIQRFLFSRFKKPYKARKRLFLKEEHRAKRKLFAEYIKREKINANEIFFTNIIKLYFLLFILKIY